jgi:hypothetical protein
MDNTIHTLSTHKHFVNGFHPALCVLLLLFSIVFSQTATNPPEMKRLLTQRLDSIEVEKQIKKRSGQPLEDLEEKTASLRDSLASIKSHLVDPSYHPAPPTPHRFGSLKSMLPDNFQPKNIFDWIIVIIGAIAIISGFILMIGVFRSSSAKKQQVRPTIRETRSAPVPPAPAFPGPIERASVKGPDLNDPLSRLRQKISEDTKNNQEDLSIPQNIPPVKAAVRNDQTPEGATINEQVINAARQGLDIQEISRRFHLGTDQVALILKVAKIQVRNMP